MERIKRNLGSNSVKRNVADSDDAHRSGNGDSFETAVVVNADNSFVGVEAEYAYISSQCGEPHKDWKLQSQGLCDRGGKPYDVLTIALSGGATRTFYFDIAKFFTP
jgi:hypothetical protein